MQIDTWLREAEACLRAADVPTARLDALVLLEDALSVDRARLLAHPDMEIPSDIQNVLRGQVERRAQHVPLAFLRGFSEFYGREFVINEAVLVPRPESEAMIELLLGRTDLPISPRIADVGTGSGALGITAQLELPKATVELLEVDDKAIAVAKMNVIKFTSSISVLRTDLLEGSSNDYHVLLCNLPYVPDTYDINAAAAHEPSIALFGGPDGLDLYRTLFSQITENKIKPLLILTEALPEQHAALREIAEGHGYAQDAVNDFIQAFVTAS